MVPYPRTPMELCPFLVDEGALGAPIHGTGDRVTGAVTTGNVPPRAATISRGSSGTACAFCTEPSGTFWTESPLEC